MYKIIQLIKIMLIYIRGREAAPAAPARTRVTFCGIKFSEQTYYRIKLHFQKARRRLVSRSQTTIILPPLFHYDVNGQQNRVW